MLPIYNQLIVDKILSQENHLIVDQHDTAYHESHKPKRNQAFLIGFDRKNRPRKIASVESKKGTPEIFGDPDFHRKLKANQHNGTTIEEKENCFNQFDQNMTGMLLK